MIIELNRKTLKKLEKEEGHSFLETSLIRYAIKLNEIMAKNNQHESELYNKTKSAFEILKKVFTPHQQDLCQSEQIDDVNWKELAVHYKKQAERWKEENHQNLIDVNRLLIEKDNYLNEIKRLGAELYKANCKEMKERTNAIEEN